METERTRVERWAGGYRSRVDPDLRAVVLVLRALNLGDLLVAVPALRALRRARPGHRLVLATTPVLAPLVARVGGVDTLLPTDGPTVVPWTGRRPELVVNLHGTGPQSHRALDALRPADRIGFRCAAAGVRWDGPDWSDVAAAHPHERERWCALLDAAGVPAPPDDLHLAAPARPAGPRAVIVHPGARFGAKRWPADRFAHVAAALDGPGTPVVVTGSAEERPLAEDVARRAGLPADRVLAGRTDLADLCDLVAGAALLISGDTGVAHVASAYATPSVVLFGPVDPTQWGPPVDGPHRTLGDPDARYGRPFADEPDPALLAVGVSDVLDAAAAVAPPVATGDRPTP